MAQDITTAKTVSLSPRLMNLFSKIGTNLRVSEAVPSLLFSGKVWKIRIKDTVENIMRSGPDGEAEPETIVRLIVIGVNDSRSRAYFAGKYDPDSPAAPECWSYDGNKPDASIAEPQAKSCATCQWSVKGSKINEMGKETTACSVSKRLAVVPANDITFEPLLLKLPITSTYDGNLPHKDKNWYAWDQYVKFLNSRVPNAHSAMFVTAVRFDPDVDYPKLEFKCVSLVPDNDDAYIEQLAEVCNSDKVKTLLGVPTEAKLAEDTDTDGKDELSKARAAKQAKAEPAPEPAPKTEQRQRGRPAKPKEEPAPPAALPEDDIAEAIPPGFDVVEGDMTSDDLDSILGESW